MTCSSKNSHDHLPGGVPGEFAPMRLQKFLARAGVASRRHSEELIVSGRVCVNGEVVTEMGFKVDPHTDSVELDGSPVSLGEAPVTIMLNKPAGYVTTMDDPEGRPCVAQIIPSDTYPGLFPVGRLDCDTTGLLLFTNDGQLGYRLAHPKYHVDKTYVAKVQGRAGKKQIAKLRVGVQIRGGLTSPARVREVGKTPYGSILQITIHEGMNRQVRRMCAAVGLPVQELERISMGPLGLGSLEQGCWRVLDQAEIDLLCDASEHARPRDAASARPGDDAVSPSCGASGPNRSHAAGPGRSHAAGPSRSHGSGPKRPRGASGSARSNGTGPKRG